MIALALLAALSPATPTAAEKAVVQRMEPEGTPKPEGTETPMKSAAENAIADLAVRLGVDATAITVISLQSVTWSDGSIGCPEPGFAYPQVLVPGQRIVLEANGARYEYHAGTTNMVRYCANPMPAVGE